MIQLGKIQTLIVQRRTTNGIYLSECSTIMKGSDSDGQNLKIQIRQLKKIPYCCQITRLQKKWKLETK